MMEGSGTLESQLEATKVHYPCRINSIIYYRSVKLQCIICVCF